MACMVNKENRQKGRVPGGVSQIGDWVRALLGRIDAGFSASSASARLRIKGVLGKRNGRVGEVGTGGRLGCRKRGFGRSVGGW